MDSETRIKVLEGALTLLGENGENWIKHDYETHGKYFCLLGAIGQSAINCGLITMKEDAYGDPGIYSYENEQSFSTSDFADLSERFGDIVSVNGLARDEGWDSVPAFNDEEDTAFSDIKEFVERRIEQLRAEETSETKENA